MASYARMAAEERTQRIAAERELVRLREFIRCFREFLKANNLEKQYLHHVLIDCLGEEKAREIEGSPP